MLISSSRKTSIDTTTMVRAIKPRRLLMRVSTERAPPQKGRLRRARRRLALRPPGTGRTLRCRRYRASPLPETRRRAEGGGVMGPLPRWDRLPDPDLVELIVVGRVLLQVVH